MPNDPKAIQLQAQQGKHSVLKKTIQEYKAAHPWQYRTGSTFTNALESALNNPLGFTAIQPDSDEFNAYLMTIDLLLEHGADRHWGLRLAIRKATNTDVIQKDTEDFNGLIKIVEVFLKRGANPNKKMERYPSLLHYIYRAATKDGLYEEKTIDTDIENRVTERMHVLVKLLVQYKVDLEKKFRNRTVFGQAVYEWNYSFAKMFIQRGANINSQQALFDAVDSPWQYDPKIVALLLDNDANPNVLNHENQTPLIHLFARSNGNEYHFPDEKRDEILKQKEHQNTISTARLFDFGPEYVNSQDDSGNTALHYAVMHWGDYADGELSALLVSFGANVELKNKDDKSPLDLLKERE